MIRKILLAAALALGGFGGTVAFAGITATQASAGSAVPMQCNGVQASKPGFYYQVIGSTTCDDGNAPFTLNSSCVEIQVYYYGYHWIIDNTVGGGPQSACDNDDTYGVAAVGLGQCYDGSYDYKTFASYTLAGQVYWVLSPGTYIGCP